MKIGLNCILATTRRTIRNALFVQMSPGSGAFTLPSWLAITCATTGRTTQTSATTLIKGLGANVARARNVGSGWGLSVESARTNLCTNSEALGSWNALNGATITNVDGQTDPSGTSTADKLNWTSAGQSLIYSGPTIAINNAGVASAWVLADTATTIDQYDGNAGLVGQNFAISASTWRRAILSNPAVHAAATNYCYGRNSTATAGAAWLWGAQLEQGALYPGSYIPATASSVLRAADVLTATTSAISTNGFFAVDFTFAPNYTQTEFTNDHNLVYFGANDRVYLKQSDKTLRLRLGGVDIASTALTFAREDAIRVQATHSQTRGRRLVVSKNGVPVYDSGTQSVGSAISLPGSVGILCDGTAALECADLRSIAVLRP